MKVAEKVVAVGVPRLVSMKKRLGIALITRKLVRGGKIFIAIVLCRVALQGARHFHARASRLFTLGLLFHQFVEVGFRALKDDEADATFPTALALND